MNNVVLVGRLTRDPELRYMSNMTSVANFTLAVNRDKKDEVDFIDIVCFGNIADNVVQYIGKGSLVAINGSIRVDSFTTKDGKSAKSFKINANKVNFLDTKSTKVVDDPELPWNNI